MTFAEIQRISGILAKNYAEDFFKLLVNYESISATESATRLNLHIKTCQDFLETLYEVNYLSREQVIDKKRPYYRYKLIKQKIDFYFGLNQFKLNEFDYSNLEIKENIKNDCIFISSPKTGQISGITLFEGEGRKCQERKIQLTKAQGNFLLFLPLPTSDRKKVKEILSDTGTKNKFKNEILDLITILIKHEIIDYK